ncbi:MAG: hypothetical protein VX699_11645 [Myxococcota bacterium]|nr:hypothetical protein [Myxococcota bacterium]
MKIKLDTNMLGALLAKYDLLVGLRREREDLEAKGIFSLEGEALVERQARMREVAAEFPGALRELEALSAAQLTRRREEVARRLEQEGGEGAEDSLGWMEVTVAFHRLLKRVLVLKRFLGKRKGLSESQWQEVVEALVERSDLWDEGGSEWLRAVDVSQINGYLTPPERRVVNAVWRELSEELGASVETLQALMLEGE